MNNELLDALLEISALKDELANSNAILDIVPAMIFINEAWFEGEIYQTMNVYANKYAHEQTGWTREACDKMGPDFGRKVIHPDDYEVAQHSFDFLCSPENIGKEYSGPYRYKFANGEYGWGIGSVRVLKPLDNSGHRQFVNILVPVTEAMHLNNQIMELIAENLRMGKQHLTKKISPAEMRVLKLVGQGLENTEIAEKLRLAERTITTHKSNIMKKLGLHSSAALVIFTTQNGIM